MADYYGYRSSRSSYIPSYHQDVIEYPGYDSTWVLGRASEGFYTDEYHRTPSSYQYYPGRSRANSYQRSYYDQTGRTHLAWATEIPLRLRVTLCCEGCKRKLEKALRDMHGVHDVGIAGWSDAMVTVTGTAPARKILKKARKFAKSAEIWIDSPYPDEYGSRYSYGGHY